MAEPGGLHSPSDTLSFVSDNQRKGISEVPALTIHAAAGWSDTHWKDSNAQLINELTALAEPFVGNSAIVERQIKKWRFATPRTAWPEPCWVAAEAAGPLALAGDAFAGPRVEGAVLSGLAAAATLL